ncbi:hypothetical protein T440DRAFT_456084 [Plenodomus tracheiphilus IPT5]|uniref:DUF7730 domain-containing protein n=1 Tax=Plenodomus tracheiphilus IPT5 TaxID=1408161 RepID=A0A6A7AZV8_9PLEO|nr:hypothetical protein T440DRAFT_456084 [Plenodomus tracheiphilus IPT5]
MARITPAATLHPPGRTIVERKPRKNQKPWTYKKYRDGSLNLKAPAHLMRIFKVNRQQSPLLKLPAEIRNRIFAYASGGSDIYITASCYKITKVPQTLPDGQISHIMEQTYELLTTIVISGEEYRSAQEGDVIPNFHLARVCRQLYQETCLLPYQLNHFRFINQWDALFKPTGKYSGYYYNVTDLWLQLRSRAQIKVLASFAPCTEYYSAYRCRKRPIFSSRFPDLKKLDLVNYEISQGEDLNAAWSKGGWHHDKNANFEVVPPVHRRKEDRTMAAHYQISEMMKKQSVHYVAIVCAPNV